jgi:hypothetical protein
MDGKRTRYDSVGKIRLTHASTSLREHCTCSTASIKGWQSFNGTVCPHWPWEHRISPATPPRSYATGSSINVINKLVFVALCLRLGLNL